MEQTTPNSTKIAGKWALINLITGIVITYIFEITKMDFNSPIRYLAYIPLIAFLLLAQKEHKDQQGGYIKFGEAFTFGCPLVLQVHRSVIAQKNGVDFSKKVVFLKFFNFTCAADAVRRKIMWPVHG